MSNTVVNTNVLALNSHRSLKTVGAQQAKSSSRLSSGLRINSAADDAAGLAISEKMRSQIRGLDQASRNAQDGISMIQTAEGGLQEIDNMLQRIRELTVQAANDTNDNKTGDRVKIRGEVSALVAEIDSMANRVQFNNRVLLKGSVKGVQFQVGANGSQAIQFSIGSMNSYALGLTKVKGKVKAGEVSSIASAIGGKVSSSPGIKGSTISRQIKKLDKALGMVTAQRAKLGALQNRLEYTVKSLEISSENMSASESRIRDADMAKEMMNLTKSNVLQQAATSMLAQANQAPQGVLRLLG